MAITKFTVFDPAVDTAYFFFRLPAILRAGNGDLLAFAEGRVDSADDDGNIDIVMKRSTNNGVAWGSLVVVSSDGTAKQGNPVPILNNFDSNKIVLHYTRTGYTSAGTIACNTVDEVDRRRPFIRTSTDDGLNWSAGTEITSQVKPSDFRHFVGGPGHGICIQNGPNAGRLVIQGAFSKWSGNALDTCETWNGAYCIYSDDNGANWTLGAQDAPSSQTFQPNEAAMAELDDGHLYVNVRDQGASNSTNRLHTWSEDGGETFTSAFAPLPDTVMELPQCHCSVWKLSATADPVYQRLIFSGPLEPADRDQIVFRQSFNGGKTWHPARTVETGQGGYSDLCENDGVELGCLYENGNGVIKYARVPVADIPRPLKPVSARAKMVVS